MNATNSAFNRTLCGGILWRRRQRVFAAAAFGFDLVVVAWIVAEGWRHFAQPVLWLAYTVLIIIPWLVGKAHGVADA